LFLLVKVTSKGLTETQVANPTSLALQKLIVPLL